MTNRFIGFAAALAVWLVYFYGIDLALMDAQGIPVGWDLMPG